MVEHVNIVWFGIVASRVPCERVSSNERRSADKASSWTKLKLQALRAHEKYVH